MAKAKNCKNPKGFTQIASCKAQGKIARTGGKHKGRKVKSKKYGGKAVKQLKRIKNIPGAGMVGRGVARGAGIATGALATLDLVDSAAGAVRTGGNIYRRLKGQPILEDIGGFGKAEKFYRIKEKNEYLKKHGSLKGFDKSVSRWNK